MEHVHCINNEHNPSNSRGGVWRLIHTHIHTHTHTHTHTDTHTHAHTHTQIQLTQKDNTHF